MSTQPIFREQVTEQEKALERAQLEILGLERDKQRLSDELNQAKTAKIRLGKTIETLEAQVTDLTRRLSQALQGQEQMSELQRAKETSEESQRRTQKTLDEVAAKAAEQKGRILQLETANSGLAETNTGLEKEIAPMRPIVQALKDRLDADRRIALEAEKL